MNEAFETLPQEKQMRIINAAMEVFACNEYKRASTDDIAAKAGISKGLLFYYFHNKEALYLYVYEYCRRITTEQILDTQAILNAIFLIIFLTKNFILYDLHYNLVFSLLH